MNAVDVCSICGGSGWKIVERGGISGAEKCECIEAWRAQRNEARASIPPLYQQASVDNFILPAENPISRSALAKVLVDVRGYVREYPGVPKPGLLFLGPPGTGKLIWRWRHCGACWHEDSRASFSIFNRCSAHIHRGYDQASGTMERKRTARRWMPRFWCWTIWAPIGLPIGWKTP